MPAVTIQFRVDDQKLIPFQRRLARLEVEILRPTDQWGTRTFRQIDRIITEHFRVAFLQGKQKKWTTISAFTLIFSRKTARGGPLSFSTLKRADAFAKNRRKSNLMVDTGDLFRSVARINDANHLFQATARTIRVGTTLPYAVKHTRRGGFVETFPMGTLERARMDKRVFRPPALGKGGLKKARGRGSIIFKERYFYKLRTLTNSGRWPFPGRVPQRSWVKPLPPDGRKLIVDLYSDNFFDRALDRNETSI